MPSHSCFLGGIKRWSDGKVECSGDGWLDVNSLLKGQRRLLSFKVRGDLNLAFVPFPFHNAMIAPRGCPGRTESPFAHSRRGGDRGRHRRRDGSEGRRRREFGRRGDSLASAMIGPAPSPSGVSFVKNLILNEIQNYVLTVRLEPFFLSI